jgi:HEPN domain-containing protein
MLPPSNPIPGSPEQWLARAKADLALAKVPLPPGGCYEDLCFHAQQAAEKALKAIYVARGQGFRYVHDLEELLTGLQKNGLRIPEAIQHAAILTSYAVETRYPGMTDPVTAEEYRQAVFLAEQVVRWAEQMLTGPKT